MAKPKYSEVFGSRFMTGPELAPIGEHRSAVIVDVTMETVGRDSDEKLCLHLASSSGKPYPRLLVLNKTNGRRLRDVHGDDCASWVNQPIEIWSEYLSFEGKDVVGIRLMPVPVPGKGPAAADGAGGVAADLDDEIPF
jgi:hypothetical protein